MDDGRISLNPPPGKLDGARVLWWAWSGEVPFGELSGAEENDRLIFGFAVCRYENEEFYRFTCNKHWDVVQDTDHQSESDAKADIPSQHDAPRVVWQRYER